MSKDCPCGLGCDGECPKTSDEKRMADVRARLHSGNFVGSYSAHETVEFMVRMYDESEHLRDEADRRVGEVQEMLSESERARTEAERVTELWKAQWQNERTAHVDVFAAAAQRAETAETALAEELAKGPYGFSQGCFRHVTKCPYLQGGRPENCDCVCGAAQANSIMTEERAKREVAETQSRLCRAVIVEDDEHYVAMRGRAETAERSLAETIETLTSVRITAKVAMDQESGLRAELKAAEARVTALEAGFATPPTSQGAEGSVTSVPGNSWDVIHQDRDEWKRRSVKAEARVRELESILHHYAFCPEVPGGTPLEKVPEMMSKRVAELEKALAVRAQYPKPPDPG